MKGRILKAGFSIMACYMLLIASCGMFKAEQSSPPLPKPYPKVVSFSICEDYDKGQDLKYIAEDFKLVRRLGIDTMRVSFGWDDYEPARGKYDFDWLHKFADLAAQHGIKLRPYICYAPSWAVGQGKGWNAPPKDYKDWYNFCFNLARALKRHPNIVSYEIWNEQDTELWWEGSIQQYRELLKQAVLAIRKADAGKQILLGGLTRPADDWLLDITRAGHGQYYDIVPLHCYVETSTWGDQVEDYLTGGDFLWFIAHNNTHGQREPIWINEIGYSLLRRSERDQANYMCRAVAHLLSCPDVRHIGWYEITDLKPEVQAIGDTHNYHLGITSRPDRKPRLAFYTLDMLTDLLDKKKILPAADELKVKVTSGAARRIYRYLFKLSDGSQVLFIYTKGPDCTVDVRLKTPGKTAHKFELNNTHAVYPRFTGDTLSEIALKRGEVQVFRIVP
jgi:hypothetical protein